MSEDRGVASISKEEFIARFVAEMCKRVPFENFDDEDGPEGNGQGGTVKEYAEAMAPSYWEDEDQRADGPEECAREDLNCWE